MIGRMRKGGPRYPSGELKREPEGYHPIAVKRLVDAAVARVSDPRFGTPLGRMHLEGKINAAEYSAGLRWDGLRREYLAAIAAGTGDPRSASLEPGRSSAEPDPESFAGVRLAKKHIAAVREFAAVEKVLRAQGNFAYFAVKFLCEGKGSSLNGHKEYIAIKQALKILSQHFADQS